MQTRVETIGMVVRGVLGEALHPAALTGMHVHA
jgi:hypothetical protein